MSKRRLHPYSVVLISGAALAAVALVARGQDQPGSAAPGATPAPSSSASAQPALASQRKLFFAQLNPANGSGVSGTVRMVLENGGNLGVFLNASGLAPEIRH